MQFDIYIYILTDAHLYVLISFYSRIKLYTRESSEMYFNSLNLISPFNHTYKIILCFLLFLTIAYIIMELTYGNILLKQPKFDQITGSILHVIGLCCNQGNL